MYTEWFCMPLRLHHYSSSGAKSQTQWGSRAAWSEGSGYHPPAVSMATRCAEEPSGALRWNSPSTASSNRSLPFPAPLPWQSGARRGFCEVVTLDNSCSPVAWNTTVSTSFSKILLFVNVIQREFVIEQLHNVPSLWSFGRQVLQPWVSYPKLLSLVFIQMLEKILQVKELNISWTWPQRWPIFLFFSSLSTCTPAKMHSKWKWNSPDRKRWA